MAGLERQSGTVAFVEIPDRVIPVLRVNDAELAVSWHARLGFQRTLRQRFEPGCQWFAAIARGCARVHLSEREGDAPARSLVDLYVDDVDVVARESGVPVDEQGLAAREVESEDPDGNRLRVATPR